mmetsp:Transcript_6749/g.12174  ORF Transcript_6749/g.12174 Transcript_6749/m.12174 type:complete len:259 (-) Transcript_6749:510-1286(-)
MFCVTNATKAEFGMNRLPPRPETFLMRVCTSSAPSCSKMSMSPMAGAKTSWKIPSIRAPPVSSRVREGPSGSSFPSMERQNLSLNLRMAWVMSARLLLGLAISPMSAISFSFCAMTLFRSEESWGKTLWMCFRSIWEHFLTRYAVPSLSWMSEYEGCMEKYCISPSRALAMPFLSLMSACDLLTTPTYPRARLGRFVSSPVKMPLASVPRSIRSSLVRTPRVRFPCGSTSLAISMASLLAKSVLAAVTARIKQLGLEA